MKKLIALAWIILTFSIPCCSQPQGGHDQVSSTEKIVGGQCEDCDALYEYGTRKLSWSDTLPDYGEKGPKTEISGTIYKRDGKTPAPNVILYIYHTDQQGNYPKKGDETGWAKRHGYIRGWVMTDANGRYKFYTLKPAAYPGRKDPAHIHATLKESDTNAYWIDEFLFDDDPLLNKEHRNALHNRGGNGILKLMKGTNGILTANRDIILGMNIPNY